MNPALVGLLGALPRLTDAITDPLMGYISDNTRSRWGRRRPYIFAARFWWGSSSRCSGSCRITEVRTTTLVFPDRLLSFLSRLYHFRHSWVALGYELTPDYHERTRLMGVQNFMGQFAYLLTPWLLVLIQNETYFENMVDGAGGLCHHAGSRHHRSGWVPAVFLRERFVTPSHTADGPEGEATGFTQRILANIREFFPDSGYTQSQRLQEALHRHVSRLQWLHHGCRISVLRHYLLRVRRGHCSGS